LARPPRLGKEDEEQGKRVVVTLSFIAKRGERDREVRKIDGQDSQGGEASEEVEKSAGSQGIEGGEH